VGAALLTAVGLCCLGLFIFWNPLVLRPRMWSDDVVARSFAVDLGLFICGAGLIARRRWAALLAALAGLAVAVILRSSMALWGFGLLLLPLVLAVSCWGVLTPTNTKRDKAIVAIGLALTLSIHVAAYIAYRHHWR